VSGSLPSTAELSVVTPPDDDPDFGENHALWLWDEEHRVGIHLYLKTLGHLHKYGLRRETVNVHLPDGRVLMSEADGPGNTEPWTARGPNLQFQCVEPFRRWAVRYDGTAQPTSAREMQAGLLRHLPLVPLELDLQLTMVSEPLVSGTIGEPGEREWASRFYGGSRYEQLLWATGSVRTSDAASPVHGGGVRTHRVGRRNTQGFPGLSWLTGVFPSGRAFCVERFCGADGSPQWEEAFIEKDGRREHARGLAVPLASFALPGEIFDVVLEASGGTETIHCVLRATNFVTSMPVEPLRFCWGIDTSNGLNRVMSQGLARYSWDGEIGVGMIQRSVRVHEMPAVPEEDRDAG
jgi:hypothetical protein